MADRRLLTLPDGRALDVADNGPESDGNAPPARPLYRRCKARTVRSVVSWSGTTDRIEVQR